MAISLSDQYGSLSTGTVSLSGGVSVSPFNVTLAVSTQTFPNQVIYVNGFGLPTSTSSVIPVNTGAPTHLQLVLPGETAVPGLGGRKNRNSTGAFGGNNQCDHRQSRGLSL